MNTSVLVTTGSAAEGEMLFEQLDDIERRLGKSLESVFADKGYGFGKHYGPLGERNTRAYIPVRVDRSRRHREAGFVYNGEKDHFVCPAGAVLTNRGHRPEVNRTLYRSKSSDCVKCPLLVTCTAGKVSGCAARRMWRSDFEDEVAIVREREQTADFKEALI